MPPKVPKAIPIITPVDSPVVLGLAVEEPVSRVGVTEDEDRIPEEEEDGISNVVIIKVVVGIWGDGDDAIVVSGGMIGLVAVDVNVVGKG